MQQVDVVVYQVTILALLGLTGYIVGKVGYLPKETGVVLSRVVIKLTAPILIVTTLADYNFSTQTIIDGAWVFMYALIFLLLAFLAAMLVSKRLNLEEASRNIYTMQSMFGNVIFLAFPLLQSLYQEKGLIYAVFFFLASDSILWTLGIYLLNKHKANKWKDNLKHLINGNTIAFTTGLVFIGVNLQYYVHTYPMVQKVYNLLYNTFSPLGKTTIYLSMLFIGLILSEIKIDSYAELIKRYSLLVLSFFKLILIPVIALAVLSAMGSFVDPYVKSVVVLQLAMPSGTIVAALAAQYDSDYRFATECVFVSTILGLVTLPLMVYLLQVFG